MKSPPDRPRLQDRQRHPDGVVSLRPRGADAPPSQLAGGTLNTERIQSLYSMVEAAVADPPLSMDDFASHTDIHLLDKVTDDSARKALWAVLADTGPNDIEAWPRTAATVQRMRDRGLCCSITPARLRAFLLVENRVEAAFPSLPLDAIHTAVERLFQRVGEAQGATRTLQRRAPRWRRAPSASVSGAPVIEADLAEVAVAALLSETKGQWQFSSTPDGRMFTGSRRGYHAEAERTYLDGLSDIVDTASSVVEQHRAGVGGRVYVYQDRIACAECNLVVAWIEHEGTGTTAFRACRRANR